MKTRKYEGPNAIVSARRQAADARALCTLIQRQLRELEDAAEANPKNWGYSGSGAEVRSRLEQIAMFLDSENDCDSEDENRRAVRIAAGLNPDWK
ncbi:MAG: hypothetical protein KAI41_08810 [Hyphomicrobiaceae bacterium]|nr:hypothetical protein [Hyphomicrobiaceae bacterium]MCK5495389.1 hypothetical protein [Hyphomicrobiaceae bacterium]MCK5550618.1 hypothetical protein [Hyphomicrobiaceae bacterium]